MIKEPSDNPLKRVQWDAGGEIRLDLLGSVRFPEGHRGALHSHSFWELIYIGEGSGTLQLGTGLFPCAAGEILLVSPEEMHRLQADATAPLDQLYLGFSFEVARDAQMPAPPPRTIPAGPFADLIRSELNESLAILRNKASVEAVRSRLLAVASRVMGFLLPPEGGASLPDKGRTESPIRLAKEILHSDLKGRHDVPDLARRFHLSPQYFGELFKRDTGMSVKEFQRECRMEMAMALLRGGTFSITEVADKVGLEDAAYFSRLFKKKFGMSPRQARSSAALP